MITIEGIKQDIELSYFQLKKRKVASNEQNIVFNLKTLPVAKFSLPFDFDKSVYRFSEFDTIPTQDFVEYAYRALLKRFPDKLGGAHYNAELFSGKSRKSILTKLVYSKEAKNKQVKLKGSLFSAASVILSRLPILSNISNFFSAITNVAKFQNTQRSINETLSANQVKAQLKSEQLNESLAQLPRIIDMLQNKIKSQYQQIELNLENLHELILNNQSESLEKVMNLQNELNHNKSQIQEQFANLNHSVGRLEERSLGLKQELDSEINRIDTLTKEYEVDDQFYKDFEDKYRGPVEEIKNRFRVYVPILEKYISDSTAKGLDIGCGRGEWLDLMNNELNISFKGTDINAVLSKSSKHEIILGDFFEVYKEMIPGSLDVITSFHLIEHLPVSRLIEFVKTIFSLLKPGGILILETPSPLSIITSATNYYLDLTHRKPVHPLTLKFLLEHEGFQHLETKFLQPHPHYDKFIQEAKEVIQKALVRDLYGFQDYGIIVRKPKIEEVSLNLLS